MLEVIGADGEVTEAKLKKMRYLKASFHECQRMIPAVIGVGRRTHVDKVLSGYQIPQGSQVFYFTMNSTF